MDFEPSVGSEIQKTRPAVIVSNNSSNAALNRLQVLPLTSNSGRVYPSEAVVQVAGRSSKAMADQLTTADKKRFKSRLGRLSATDMRAVEVAIQIQLDLNL